MNNKMWDEKKIMFSLIFKAFRTCSSLNMRADETTVVPVFCSL